MDWSKKIDAILSCGISLHDMGHYNWALSKEQALTVCDKFVDQKLTVFGGDLYELVDGALRPSSTYDNWYCEREDGEPLDIFALRSINKARDYVNNYNHPSGKETFYVFVVAKDIADFF